MKTTLMYGVYFLLALVTLFFVGGHCALEKCTRVNDCACQLKNKTQINITPLGYQGSKAPRFPYTPPSKGSQYWEFAFNPCYDFTDKYCKDVIACEKNKEEGKKQQFFGLGSASTAEWSVSDDKYTITYHSTDKKRSTVVSLVCSESASVPKLDVEGQKDEKTPIFYFTLTSKCACPGACGKVTLGGGISVGSVICIMFAVLIVVYFVGGVLFMKFARHAEGRDIIPNAGFWTELPGNIKDGAMFSVSCCRKGGPKYDDLG